MFVKPDAAAGARWNGCAFAVRLPEQVQVITKKDMSYPDFAP